MGLNSKNTKEKRDEKYDDKKASEIDKAKEVVKDKVDKTLKK
jgi:hypothetical protein